MEEERKKTLIKLWLASHTIHNDLVKMDSSLLNPNESESKEMDNAHLKNQLYLASLAAGALLLSMFKDKMIKKEDNSFQSLIKELDIHFLLSKLVRKHENKYYLGEIDFDSELQAFDYLRNKLLHGDYHIERDSFQIHREEKTATIPIPSFIKSVLEMQDYMNYLTKDSTRGILSYPNPYSTKSIRERIEDGSEDYYEIHIRKKGKRTLSKKDMEMFDNYIMTLKGIMQTYNCDLKRAMDYFQGLRRENKWIADVASYLESSHIVFEITKKDLKTHPNYEEALRMVQNPNTILSDFVNQKTTKLDYAITSYIENKLENQASIRERLTSIALRNYINVLYYNIQGKKEDRDNILNQSIHTVFDDLSIASSFVCFYCEYHYGLDEIYSNGRLTSLMDLLKNKKLQFKEVDETILDDENMTMDLNLNSLREQAIKIQNEHQKLEVALEKLQVQYNNIKENKKIPDRIKQQIEENLFLARTKKEEYDALEEELDKFSIDKYERKLNILNHIRNAFAHGTVRICPYEEGDTLRDRKIIIEDIYNGKVTYHKVITYKEMHTLFREKTNRNLLNFVTNNMTEEGETIAFHDLDVERNDENHLVDEEEKEEWKSLLDYFIKHKMDKEIFYMQMAYVQMYIAKILKEEPNGKEFLENTKGFVHSIYSDTAHYQGRDVGTKEECYERIIHYVGKYSKYCPRELREAVLLGKTNAPTVEDKESTYH